MKTAVIIGAGGRGNIYAHYSELHPEQLKIVGVAEPNAKRRNLLKEKHNLIDNVFENYDELFAAGRIADIAVISTQDNDHINPAKKAIEQGYHLLLEKPIAPDKASVLDFYDFYKKNNSVVAVAHVLRYVPFFKTLKKLITENYVGKIRCIQHNENIGIMHYSHSYVRGNWRNEKQSSPIILAKSCHDMDILKFLTDEKCESLVSFGSRNFFTSDRKPKGSPQRCSEGCLVEGDCPFNVFTAYNSDDLIWAKQLVESTEDSKSFTELMKTSPYGRCVYSCDNDVLENQTVMMKFSNNIEASFIMSAFTPETSRTIKVMGENGIIRGNMEKNEIEIHNFTTKAICKVEIPKSIHGHGGGDFGIMKELLLFLDGKIEKLESSLDNSIESHLMAFAAEESRKESKVVKL